MRHRTIKTLKMKALFSDHRGKSWHMPLAACLIYVNEQVRFLPPVKELSIPSLDTFGIVLPKLVAKGSLLLFDSILDTCGYFFCT